MKKKKDIQAITKRIPRPDVYIPAPLSSWPETSDPFHLILTPIWRWGKVIVLVYCTSMLFMFSRLFALWNDVMWKCGGSLLLHTAWVLLELRWRNLQQGKQRAKGWEGSFQHNTGTAVTNQQNKIFFGPLNVPTSWKVERLIISQSLCWGSANPILSHAFCLSVL